LNPLNELRSRGYPVELFDPARADRYAVVVYSKSYDGANQAEASTLRKVGVRIVFDLCDNHFYNPGRLPGWEQAGRDLRCMMGIADELVASTNVLADVIKEELGQSRPVTVVGDAVETELRTARPLGWGRVKAVWRFALLRKALARDRREGRTPIVWFGHHGSPYADGGLLDLQKIRSVLEAIDARHPLSLSVISNSTQKYQQAIQPWRIPTRYLAWHSATFLRALRAHSICVIPVESNPFTRCKSNNRLALSLSVGVPVVANAIPSYEPFRSVCALDRWEEGLERYLANPEARRNDTMAGKAIADKVCSITRIATEWRTIFDRLLSRL